MELTPQIDAVLERLELTRPEVLDLRWLAGAYSSWTHRVPFDNLAKLRAVRAGASLPSLEPPDLFEVFLRDGSFGTCFAQALGFHALLTAVGYDARTYAGQTSGPDTVPGEHASVVVQLEQGRFLVDPALPHGQPLRLFSDRPSKIDGVMTPMTATPFGPLWRLDFVLLHSGARRQAVLTEELCDVAQARARWQRTLSEPESPFSRLPVARLELPTGCLTLVGRKLYIVDYDREPRVEPAGPQTLARFGIDPQGYEPLWDRP